MNTVPFTDRPLVSLIVLNYNGEEIIAECLDSLIKTRYPAIEIIVVDNSSTDQSRDILKKYPNIQTVLLSENIGYPAGNNVGFKYARGAFIATINNDITVEPDWLDQAMPFFNDPQVGIIGCRQMDYYDRTQVNSLFAAPDRCLGFGHAGSTSDFETKPQYQKPGYIIAPNGASAVFRKKCLDEIGWFEERYFAYHEDIDLYMRAFLHGWKCVFVPNAVAYHRQSYSFKKNKSRLLYLTERNRYWFTFKFFPLRLILRRSFYFIRFELWIIKNHLKNKGWGDAFLLAKLHGITGLRFFIRARESMVPLFKKKEHLFLELAHKKIITLPDKLAL